MRQQTQSRNRVGVFFQSPLWRYEYVRYLDNSRSRLTSDMQDEYIVRLLRIIRAERQLSLQPIPQEILQRRLVAVDPYMAMAYEFSKNASKLSLHSLEGHLLTDLTDEEIADRFEVEPEVIEAYARCFFDVRDRLSNIEYIAGSVIGPVLQSGIESLNTRLLCKYFGYFGGPMVLRAVLYGATNRVSISSDDEILGYLERTFEQSMMIQSATTAMMHAPSRFDLRTLVEGFVGIKSIRKDTDGSEAEWASGIISILRKNNVVPRGTPAREAFVNDSGLSVSGVILEPRSSVKIAAMGGDIAAIQAIEECKNEQHLDVIRSRRVTMDDPNAVKLER